MRRRQQPSDLPDPRPSLIDGQQDRFKKGFRVPAAYLRRKAGGYHSAQADICRAAGDLEGAAKHAAIAEAAQALTSSLAWGPPVPFPVRRPAPPGSPDEP